MARTAPITGASSGVGWELAKLLADDGFDVVIVGRVPARLEELAQELEERYRVSAFVLSKDLTRDAAAREVVSMLAEHHDREADVLVNGASFGHFGPFAEVPPGRVTDLMHVNMVAPSSLTRYVLPGMIRRGWGRVVNLASNAAFEPGPLMALLEDGHDGRRDRRVGLRGAEARTALRGPRREVANARPRNPLASAHDRRPHRASLARTRGQSCRGYSPMMGGPPRRPEVSVVAKLRRARPETRPVLPRTCYVLVTARSQNRNRGGVG
jgi:NAD(P)-dependent dehydrogenase (short-subunit alcohol dehydrogenase family)